MEITEIKPPGLLDNHSHAWRGVWNRPMYMDEDRMHPFNVARMTNHNVKGRDRIPVNGTQATEATDTWADEGGGTSAPEK